MGKALHILLVEDHVDTQHMMRRLLMSFGHGVQTAGTLQDALAAAGTARFDLVICDLGLPDGSGVELMDQLRTQYGLRGIALTGYGDEDPTRTAQVGFVAHLTKPVSFEALQKVIGQVAP